MGQEFINLFIAVSGVIVSIIAFIWRLSNKYTNIENNIVLIKAELEDTKKNVNSINSRVNANENRMDILTTNINNMTNVMVLKSDLTRLETEMTHLKDTIDDIKTTLRDSIKLNTVQYQEVSQKLGLIIGQYSEIKDFVKK
jgi:predicted  nucleic acid-binding Zn-ribbon protein